MHHNTLKGKASFLSQNTTILSNANAYNEFKQQYSELIRISSFTPKIRAFLTLMIGAKRYSNLTQKQITKITGIDKSTISRIKRKPYTDQSATQENRGRKTKLPNSFFCEVLKYATEQRKEGKVISLRWFQKVIADFSNCTINVSASTISRRLHHFKWRQIATQVRHPLQFDHERENIAISFLSFIRNIVTSHHLKPSNLHIMDESGILSNQIPL